MRRPILATVLMLCVATSVPAHGADTDASVAREVGALIEALARSRCEFFRNGSWYGSERAAAHLRRKYRYFERKGLLTTSEDFIARAGTASSFSGTGYRVRCPGAAEQPSAQWLGAELQRQRAARR